MDVGRCLIYRKVHICYSSSRRAQSTECECEWEWEREINNYRVVEITQCINAGARKAREVPFLPFIIPTRLTSCNHRHREKDSGGKKVRCQQTDVKRFVHLNCTNAIATAAVRWCSVADRRSAGIDFHCCLFSFQHKYSTKGPNRMDAALAATAAPYVHYEFMNVTAHATILA